MTNPSIHVSQLGSQVNSVLISVFSVAIVVMAGLLSLASFASV